MVKLPILTRLHPHTTPALVNSDVTSPVEVDGATAGDELAMYSHEGVADGI